MAQIPNPNAFTVSDGQNIYLNVDTVNSRIQITNAALANAVSATTPALGNAGTIATAGLGVSKVTPAGAVTGIILQAGSIDGQEVWIVNQGAAASTITLNTTPATANVADSATEAALAGLKARKYVWVAAASLWYPAA